MTPAQEERLINKYVTKWSKIALDARPADRKRAERAIAALYAQERPGQPLPTVRWFGSPQACQDELVKQGLKPNWLCGQHSAYWLGEFDYLRTERKLVEETKDALPLFELARSCGWCHHSEKEVWACERPVTHVDENGDLHNPTGPAIEWPDGVRWYYVHGVQVPDKWITDPESVSGSDLLAERNQTVRSAGLALFGWGKVLADLKATSLDKHPQLGELVQARLPTGPSRFLRFTCPTGRSGALRVPVTCETVLQAQAWVNRVSEQDILAMSCRT